MKNISMTLAGLTLFASVAAQAATVGNFGPYALVNTNEAASTGVQVTVPAEGRLNAYAPSDEVVKGDTQIAVSSEGRLNAYRS